MPSTDFLVIGSGIAGLTFALKAAEHGKVIIVTKKDDSESNTNYAQGGVAAVFGTDDGIEDHIRDTIEAGAGLCDPEAVRVMVTEGPELVRELSQMGVEFTVTQEGALDLGKEGGHSKRRIVHAKDYTGFEIERVLVNRSRSHPNITVLEHHLAIDLVTESNQGQIVCLGAYVLDTQTGEIEGYSAGITFLAAGGGGQVYLHTTNPAIATGDGIAMAYRAGATIANMEFVQFHPTTLYQPSLDDNERSFLISEAVRGEGGVLVNREGQRFMPGYHPKADLAPRDIVARAIDTELKTTGQSCVFLDISSIGLDRFRQRFPNIFQGCGQRGVDIERGLIPVVPAAHYVCGGVKTDLWGRSDVGRLYCAGETACTGAHGANRLASNSLLEALVFAARASRASNEELKGSDQVRPWDYVGSVQSREKVVVSHNRFSVRQLMWNYVGIVRSDKRLARARSRLAVIAEEIRDYYWKYRVTADLVELRNMVSLAGLIIDCADSRRESRGLHFNQDHPERDDRDFTHETIVRSGRVNLS
jgi:L-aspartate oxidase